MFPFALSGEFGGSGKAYSGLAFLGSNSTNNGGGWTINLPGTGAALSASRYIIVLVGNGRTANDIILNDGGTPTSVTLTVNGIAATKVVDNISDGDANYGGCWICNVGTHDDVGSDGGYDIHLTSVNGNTGLLVGAYFVSMSSATKHSVAHKYNSGGTLTTAITGATIPANGFAISWLTGG